jgi:hypothetical protein
LFLISINKKKALHLQVQGFSLNELSEVTCHVIILKMFARLELKLQAIPVSSLKGLEVFYSIFKFFDKLAPVLVPTLCVGMHLGRSAFPAIMFQMYKTQDAERPGCIPMQSVGTSSGSYQVKNLNIEFN